MAIVFRILSFFGWALVGLFGLMSLVSFTQSAALGFGLLLVALVFCPPLYQYTRRYKKRWSMSGRILAFFLGLMIAGAGASTVPKAPVPVAQITPSSQPSVKPSLSVMPLATPVAPSPSIVPSPSPSIESPDSTSSAPSSAPSIDQPLSQRPSDPQPPIDRSTANPAAPQKLIASLRSNQSTRSNINPEATPEPVPSESPVVDPMTPIRAPTYGQGCPCPYDVAKNGSSCGKRSAYSRPGGDSPICYVGDRR
jgi:hypothetical protein